MIITKIYSQCGNEIMLPIKVCRKRVIFESTTLHLDHLGTYINAWAACDVKRTTFNWWIVCYKCFFRSAHSPM